MNEDNGTPKGHYCRACEVTVIPEDTADDEWGGACEVLCMDDICRNSGHCAWGRLTREPR